jgi:hypothetical protein
MPKEEEEGEHTLYVCFSLTPNENERQDHETRPGGQPQGRKERGRPLLHNYS